jgi:hypothetical protein
VICGSITVFRTLNAGKIRVEVDPIRETLDRVLASPAFAKSEQCQRFLRYVVEHRGEPIKERQLGVEVFGRSPDYDTSEDPVVRVRATEVRKRLGQYYAAADARDVRLEIPAGAYHVEVRVREKGRRSRWWWGLGAAPLLALAVVPFLGRATALDRFWAPAVKAGGPVLIYCGQPTVYFLRGNEPVLVRDQFVGIGNAHTAASLAVLLAKRNRSVEIRYADDISFGDLRSGPAVLIGAFSNLYTLEMQDKLRFVFEQEGGPRRIRDRSDGRTWSLPNLAPDGKTPEDYAVVSRIFDSGTGQFLVMAAGITQYGTRAAGEFLTSEEMVGGLGEVGRNVQVLLHTSVRRGTPGAPEVVIVHRW